MYNRTCERGDLMLRPKTLNGKLLKEFRKNYDSLIENGYFEKFRVIIIRGYAISENIAADFTFEQFSEIAKEIFENTDFKEYEKQKYYIGQYFVAVYLNKFKEKLLNGEITPNERYNNLLNGSKNVKINWFDKIKLRLTSNVFFIYLENKYYYFWSEAEIKHIYGKSLFKYYNFLEKIFFINKYRAFAVMQDYYYNAKRIAKQDFRSTIRRKNPPTVYSTAFGLILVAFLARFMAYVIVHFL